MSKEFAEKYYLKEFSCKKTGFVGKVLGYGIHNINCAVFIEITGITKDHNVMNCWCNIDGHGHSYDSVDKSVKSVDTQYSVNHKAGYAWVNSYDLIFKYIEPTKDEVTYLITKLGLGE